MFENYSRINYPIYDNNENLIYNKQIVDLTKSYTLSTTQTSDTNKEFIFQNYELDEYETPISVSDTLYGTTKYYWVILVLNNVVNPYTDWYMNQEKLRKFVIKKYKPTTDLFQEYLSVNLSGQTNFQYLEYMKSYYGDNYSNTADYINFMNRFKEYREISLEQCLNNVHHFKDITTDKIVPDILANEYFMMNTLPVNIVAVTNYEYEYEINLKRKVIRVLDLNQLNVFVDSIKTIVQ